MKKYHGYIAEGEHITAEADFVIFGEMSDGSKCYHRMQDGEEVDAEWYSRQVIKMDGRNISIFFNEGE